MWKPLEIFKICLSKQQILHANKYVNIFISEHEEQEEKS